MTSTSYKQLWQEARRQLDQVDDLRAELERIREVVDLAGIAWHMKVDRHTPQQWRQRGLLPEVDFPHIKEPLWYASTIKEKFAEPTRRLWFDHPEREAENEDLSPAA